jgi:hypothetical protein
LFITSTKRDYLYALFRGGRDRIAYMLRSIEHLLKDNRRGAELWQQAFVGHNHPLELASRIALVGLHVQLQAFEEAMLRGRWGKGHLLSLTDIETCPVESCQLAASALELDLTESELRSAVDQRAGRHAKDPAHPYSPEQRRVENAQVEQAYGAVIDRALDWAALVGLKNDVRPTLARAPAALCA